MRALDAALFHFLNNFAGTSRLMDAAGIFVAAYSQYILVLLVLVFLWRPLSERARNRTMVAWGLGAAVVARFVVKPAIVFFTERARPFVLFPDSSVLIAKSLEEYWNSFPSGHAIFFFALSTVLFHFHRKLGIWFFAASIIMGVARIFAGVHWPSDIAGGALLGVFIGIAANKGYDVWQKRRLSKHE
ncbi:MAG: phosphatase PAP2 family protein [Candidatus Niyogibacteria bacterium]|nr:phosphatase PAP2 family protein [Candidatus Niyogibacteria bacterium]